MSRVAVSNCLAAVLIVFWVIVGLFAYHEHQNSDDNMPTVERTSIFQGISEEERMIASMAIAIAKQYPRLVTFDGVFYRYQDSEVTILFSDEVGIEGSVSILSITTPTSPNIGNVMHLSRYPQNYYSHVDENLFDQTKDRIIEIYRDMF